MRMLKLRKNLLTAAAGTVLALGVASQAMALPTAPLFTLSPIAAGLGASAPFVANQITGTSSELLQTNGTTGHQTLGLGSTHSLASDGWLQINGFSLNGNPVGGTGLLNDYNLFITFSLTDTYNNDGTGINTANSSNKLTQLNFKFWADPTRTNVFTNANATTGTAASYTDPLGNDILLAAGDLIVGVSGFDSQGGAYLNSSERFAVCTGLNTATVDGVAATGNLATLTTGATGCKNGTGNAFFADPTPFYGLAFDAFNNTLTGLAANGNLISINQAIGTIDFNRVPEPATLALLGLGLLGMGATARRRKV